ncbi:hypothetical protein EVAR_26681_1 [Eumeta japonica]|uniref:Uncharacterized protein n=1 Tax=Eumeta variegata TaxID=151549 RepID=A0A4C1VKG7_EUMVA|nr:hypothetical protein EVAR_26681_1 [Eumeta japonica]
MAWPSVCVNRPTAQMGGRPSRGRVRDKQGQIKSLEVSDACVTRRARVRPLMIVPFTTAPLLIPSSFTLLIPIRIPHSIRTLASFSNSIPVSTTNHVSRLVCNFDSATGHGSVLRKDVANASSIKIKFGLHCSRMCNILAYKIQQDPRQDLSYRSLKRFKRFHLKWIVGGHASAYRRVPKDTYLSSSDLTRDIDTAVGGLTVLEWKGRVPFTFMSVSLLGGLTMPEWKGRVPLTRSHCERITIYSGFLTNRNRYRWQTQNCKRKGNKIQKLKSGSKLKTRQMSKSTVGLKLVSRVRSESELKTIQRPVLKRYENRNSESESEIELEIKNAIAIGIDVTQQQNDTSRTDCHPVEDGERDLST